MGSSHVNPSLDDPFADMDDLLSELFDEDTAVDVDAQTKIAVRPLAIPDLDEDEPTRVYPPEFLAGVLRSMAPRKPTKRWVKRS